MDYVRKVNNHSKMAWFKRKFQKEILFHTYDLHEKEPKVTVISGITIGDTVSDEFNLGVLEMKYIW